jgi:hypothetical protein
MNLSQLQRADFLEVKSWLNKEIELTPYQYSKLDDIYSPYYFYKRKDKIKSSFLWRLTLPFFGIIYLLFVIGLPINFILTGSWGYNKKFICFFLAWSHFVGINI